MVSSLFCHPHDPFFGLPLWFVCVVRKYYGLIIVPISSLSRIMWKQNFDIG